MATLASVVKLAELAILVELPVYKGSTEFDIETFHRLASSANNAKYTTKHHCTNYIKPLAVVAFSLHPLR